MTINQHDGPPSPSVFIQWKGTDVCLDFQCECGYRGHYDGFFAYGLRCYQCGWVWEVPHTIGLLPGNDLRADPQDTDTPHDPTRTAVAENQIGNLRRPREGE